MVTITIWRSVDCLISVYVIYWCYNIVTLWSLVCWYVSFLLFWYVDVSILQTMRREWSYVPLSTTLLTTSTPALSLYVTVSFLTFPILFFIIYVQIFSSLSRSLKVKPQTTHSGFFSEHGEWSGVYCRSGTQRRDDGRLLADDLGKQESFNRHGYQPGWER